MGLVVYNTLTRTKEPLRPIEPGTLRMYVCGPTVYNLCHVGHARCYVAFDTIRRYLQHRGYAVRLVSNVTDIDDRIIVAAKKEGTDPAQLALRFTRTYLEDMETLSVLPPTVRPTVTQTLGPIATMIAALIAGGHAYEVDGNVYFAVSSSSQFGQLSHQDPAELESGARVEVDERKRDPQDFALWKAAKEGEPAWPSPWGPGRPGWHIECTAMSLTHLGEQLDIHGGGVDLVFPHHECEILQSEGVTGKAPFCRVWLHNGHVTVDEVKMSKSLGNFFTIREVLARYPASVLRFFLLNTQYRKPMDFSDGALEEASRALLRLQQTATQLRQRAAQLPPGEVEASTSWPPLAAAMEGFYAAMDDDFNTREAIAALFVLSREVADAGRHLSPEAAAVALKFYLAAEALLAIGLSATDGSPAWASYRPPSTAGETMDDAAVAELVAQRQQARAVGDFAAADAIRARLSAAGITIEDHASGPQWRRR